MKADIYTLTGTKTQQKAELPKEYFEAEGDPRILAQYVRVYRINQRRGTAKTKTRGEVAGGGRKPWRQKGTGRARQGSIRSPIWRGGGVAHGPIPRVFEAKMPKRMRRMASSLALSSKKEDVVVVRDLNLKEGRTKEILPLIKTLSLPKGTLFITAERNELLRRAVSNLKGKVLTFENLNPYEVLKAKGIVIELSALEGMRVGKEKLKMGEGRGEGKISKVSDISDVSNGSNMEKEKRKSAKSAKIRRNQRQKK